MSTAKTAEPTANLWTHTAEAAPETPPFSGEATADIVVVGAGFTGLSTALHAAASNGYDDIVQLNQGTDLRIEYQQPDGTFSGSSFMSVASSSQWGLCVADVDANGHRDVAAGGVYDDIKLVTFDPVGSSATMTTLPGATIFMQNANFADINLLLKAYYSMVDELQDNPVWQRKVSML